jgi:MFS family permease
MPRYRRTLYLVVAPSLFVAVVMAALYFVVLPLFPAVSHYYFPQSTRTYATYRVAILGHIACGTVALAVGPLNLWATLRRDGRLGRRRRLHRRLGGVYAVAVALSATCAFFMSFHAYPGTIPLGRLLITSGLATLACVWLVTLTLAVRAMAVHRDRDRHAFWMIVNVSATFSAVFFRLGNGVIVALDRFDQLYPFLGWLGWVPSVAVGVVLARRYVARRRRPTAPATTAVLEAVAR